MDAATIVMEECTCWECGITFSVPSVWFRQKMKDDEEIKCPNGHDYHVEWTDTMAQLEAKIKKLEKENEDLRRELMQEKHNAEQAEGRLRDERPAAAPPMPDVTTPPAPAVVFCQDPTGRFLCPRCGKPYRYQGSLRAHLVGEHGDIATAQQLDLFTAPGRLGER